MKKLLLIIMLLIGISYIGSSQTIDDNGIYWLPKRQYEVIKIDRCQNVYEIYLLGEDMEIYKLLSESDCKTRLFRRKSRKLIVGTKVNLTLNSWFSRSFGEYKISRLSSENMHQINGGVDGWCICDKRYVDPDGGCLCNIRNFGFCSTNGGPGPGNGCTNNIAWDRCPPNNG